MAEEWRKLADDRFSGCYEVSSHGRVRRVQQIGRRLPKPIMVSPTVTDEGYLRAALSLDRGKKRVAPMVHRLVMSSFSGKCPDGHVVNHIDGDKSHNHLSNLEYVTPQQNTRHAFASGLNGHHRRQTARLERLWDAWNRATPEMKQQFLSEVLAADSSKSEVA